MKKENNALMWLLRFFLLGFPMLHLTLGVDIADVGYSLANFEAFPHFNETWMLSTFLAQVVGKLITMLPFGHTMMGVHFYCLLILGLCAVLFFELLRKEYNHWAVFAGEMLALCLCWAPKFILYQYMTYYLFSIAALLLIKGLISERRRLLYCSGLLLGANLLVRMPNVVEAGLIVVVFYHAILKKTPVKKLLAQVGICMAGYFTVALAGILLIELFWGFGAYAGMIEGTFFMTKEATSYSPVSMIRDTLLVYVEYMKWFVWFLFGIVAGYIVYMFLRAKWMKIAFTVVFCMGYALILLFFRSRGILTSQYDEYVSVYPWMMFLLILSLAFAVGEMCWKGIEPQRKVFALMVICVIAITPIGSNNNVYSNFNNLFIIAPYLFGSLVTYFPKWKEWKWSPVKAIRMDAYPVMLMLGLIILVAGVQSLCFGVQFAFRDEGFFSKDKIAIEGNDRLRGMQTNVINAAAIEELTAFMKENGYYGTEGLFYGDISMVTYACEMPNAVSHAWPSLPSYPTMVYEEELKAVQGSPVVVFEAEEYDSTEIEAGNETRAAKKQLLMDFTMQRGYAEVYRNEKFVVLAVH